MPKMDLEYFINKATIKFENKYDYSLCVFIDSITPVKILCPIHGEFIHVPHRHLSGRGCQFCGKEKLKISKRNTKESFLNKAILIHGNNYDYSKTIYIDYNNKIEIICKIHDSFWQNVGDHLNGNGCPKCGRQSFIDTMTTSDEDFINKANIVHNFKYDYSNMNYNRITKKFNFYCELHGNNIQTRGNHLAGKGCTKCGRIRTVAYNSKNPGGWSITSWKNKAQVSKHFDSFKVYVIKCWNDEEDFYKIGRTFNTIKKRFNNRDLLPYNYEVIKIYEDVAENIHKLETTLKQKNKNNKYLPLIYFAGNQECFSKIIF